MRYEYQIVNSDAGDRPEYETKKNTAWQTVLDSDTAEGLLLSIVDWLNDENYPSDQWSRILRDGKPMHELTLC